MVTHQNWRELIGDLLMEHYDRRYHVAGDGNYAIPKETVKLSRHDVDAVTACALEVIATGERLGAGS
jgi:hypothetical protein